EYTIVYRLRPIPALLFNIAQAYRQAGLYDKARQFYKSYLRESPNAQNKAAIEQNIREMDELIAKEKRAKEGPPGGVKGTADASLPISQSPKVADATAKPGDTAPAPKFARKPESTPPSAAAAPAAAAATPPDAAKPSSATGKPPATVAMATQPSKPSA